MVHIEALRNKKDDIINCEVKDASGLNDFQKKTNEIHISIPRVGIERFRIPLNIEHADGSVMSHDSEASMFVYLESHKTGANMSRFCTILQNESEKEIINNKFFENTLGMYRKDLRDYDTDAHIPQSELILAFKYPIKQKSLKSDNWGWQYYECEWAGISNDQGVRIDLTVKYEYSSTCPCSLSMSKQYEKEFREGTTTEGNGIASAHSQRSIATVKVSYKPETEFHIEDLVDLLRIALPTETQSLVKRVDEQAFAILNGDNPMFVEHASRRISTVLDGSEKIIDWEAKVEHVESLHSHNAVAYIRKEKK